ncbi:HDOD domain-containing protein [Oleidesulfovibrio sp.]|uniref:HDOD domain-containing protein n=1 Tax=Oleidesulfovibrio sp. TaxID=2909707 RepID=UPI003A89D43D
MSRQDSANQFLQRALEAQADLPMEQGLIRDLFAGTAETSALSLPEVGEMISRDPALSARVLSLANSVYYGLQSQVSSVGRAVTVLGLREVRNLVLIIGLSAVTNSHPVPDVFSLRDYWLHQLRVAAFAKTIAAHTDDLDPEMMYTAGLLHDIGKLFMAALAPADWTAIRTLAVKSDLADHQAEDLWWGLDHALAGARVLEYWQLPTELTETISWHHSPLLAEGDFARSAKVLHLADIALIAFEHRKELPDETAHILSEFVATPEALRASLETQFAGERIGQLAALLV